MANNSVSALNAVGQGAGHADPTGSGAPSTNAAATNRFSDADQWVATFCKDYGEAMLLAGQVFLYVGLVLGIAVAAIEVYVALKAANRPAAGGGDTQGKARSLTSLPQVIEALKSLLTALSSARIWLALTILGLLLLWMAATAPRLCMTGNGADGTNNGALRSDPKVGTPQNTVANTAGNASGNASAPASNQLRPRQTGV